MVIPPWSSFWKKSMAKVILKSVFAQKVWRQSVAKSSPEKNDFWKFSPKKSVGESDSRQFQATSCCDDFETLNAHNSILNTPEKTQSRCKEYRANLATVDPTVPYRVHFLDTLVQAVSQLTQNIAKHRMILTTRLLGHGAARLACWHWMIGQTAWDVWIFWLDYHLRRYELQAFGKAGLLKETDRTWLVG